MGDHYLPQYYLRGFVESEDSEVIFRYEKGQGDYLRTGIKNVAHESKFYSDEVESYLANEIENRANPVLKKIRELRSVDAEEKRLLARYIVAMMKRVPHSKQEARRMLNDMIDPALDELASTFRQIAENEPDLKSAAEMRLLEIQQIREQKKIKPEVIWHRTIAPETTPQVSWAVEAMTWQFFFTKSDAFITSDNPVFFFKEIGIGNDSSELVFPVSTKVVLLGSWMTNSKAGFHRAKEQQVREFNKRIASSLTRYAFYCQGIQWVSKLINRKKFTLARVARNGKLPTSGSTQPNERRTF